MSGLRAWMRDHLDKKTVEPNSGLGNAFAYLLELWDKLTSFLRIRDAPLDNNLVERTLKRAIRQRNASLFYRSRRGALVGDVSMALIVTTEMHHGDPFRYPTALFKHANDVAAAPAQGRPWTYEATLRRLAAQPPPPRRERQRHLARRGAYTGPQAWSRMAAAGIRYIDRPPSTSMVRPLK